MSNKNEEKLNKNKKKRYKIKKIYRFFTCRILQKKIFIVII